MCGQYYVDNDNDELADIVAKAREKAQRLHFEKTVKTGDVRPGELVAAIDETGKAMPMQWGIKRFDGKGLVINARSETAEGKPMFRNLRHCVIPASGYYEWQENDNVKEKMNFYLKNHETMFLAGLYGREEIESAPHFVILTRQASKAVAQVHARMPVVLPRQWIRPWLYNKGQKIETSIEEVLYKKA